MTEKKTLNDQKFLKLEVFQRQMKLRLLDLGAEGKGESSFRAA